MVGEEFFDAGDVFLDRNAGDGLADDVERKVFEFFEADAGFTHVKFLAGVGIGFAKPLLGLRIAVNRHEINRHMIFLRADHGECQRLRGIAMITGGIDVVRNGVADHSALRGTRYSPWADGRRNDR